MALRTFQEPNLAGSDRAVALTLGFGAAPMPIRVPGLRGRLQLDMTLPILTAGVAIPAANGRADWQIPVPNDSVLDGLEIAAPDPLTRARCSAGG